MITCSHVFTFVRDAKNRNCPTTMAWIFMAWTIFHEHMPSFRGKHDTLAVGIALESRRLQYVIFSPLHSHAGTATTCDVELCYVQSYVARPVFGGVAGGAQRFPSTVFNAASLTLHTVLQSTLETLRNFPLHTLHPPHFHALCMLQSTFHSPHSAGHSFHSTLNTLHLMLRTSPHSPPSTILDSAPSTSL